MSHREDALATAAGGAGRRRLAMLGKAVLGLGLLGALLLWNDNGRQLLEIVAGFRVEYLLALLLIALVLAAVSSMKWALFVHEGDVRVGQLRLFELYLIGYFVNNFLPSMVAGDVARIYLLGRQISSQAASAASVLLERATGVIGMTALAAGFALLDWRLLTNPIIPSTIAVATLVCGVAIVLFYRPALLVPWLRLAASVPALDKITGKIERLMYSITDFRHRHRLLLGSLLYSFAFHLMAAVNVYVACLSIGFAPPFLDILVITPVILLLNLIPVSPNNLGWWEWSFSILLMSAGASAAEGLAVGLTLRVMTLCLSLVGAFLMARQRLGRARS